MASTGLEAGARASRKRFIANLQEFVFLTDIYGYSEADAQQALGRSDKAIYRYREYLAEHPEARLEVHAVYDGEDDDGRAETDCQCPTGESCPCEANGADGLCACCRTGEHRGTCWEMEMST